MTISSPAMEGMVDHISVGGAKPESEHSVGTLVHQVLERPLREGEDTLDDLERVFRNTAIEAEPAKSPKPAATAVDAAKDDETGKSANQSIRVTVDTLERLMTMVSELVLTRNQLLEIVRRHEESEFKTPLQRLSNVTAELQEGVMKTRMQPIGNAWQKLPRIVRDLSNEPEEDRPRDAGRRYRAGPPGSGSDQRSAHAHGAQFSGSRP
jgi:two-component system chemotaxis sensor kinase CheA